MHTQHLDLEGKKLPSVSAIPSLFAKDMSGFQQWICKGLHTKEDRCCAAAAEQYYQESADLGNDIHSLMDAFLRGDSFEEGYLNIKPMSLLLSLNFLRNRDTTHYIYRIMLQKIH